MANLKRIGCLALAVVLGVLMVGALSSSLAWASPPHGPVDMRAARLRHAARWRVPTAPDAPSIAITKTVGTDPAVCATTDAISVPASSRVIYCYTVRNTGTVTLTQHTLRDNRVGLILSNFPYALAPGLTAFITQAYTVTLTTVNTAVWTATAPSLVSPVTATDRATVTVVPLSVQLVKTVGTNAAVCATTPSVILPVGGGSVTYCYEITNTGPFTLTRHNMVDSRLGVILNDFPYSLVPGASAFLTQTAAITLTTTNVATWTARTGLSPLGATDVATVTVWVEPLVRLPYIRR